MIDVHIHGMGRFDTRTSDPEHILSIAEICGQSGVDAIVPTVYTGPLEIMRRNLRTIREAMEHQQRSWLSSKESSQTARILGAHLEGPFLNPAKSGALRSEDFLPPDVETYKRLAEGYEDIIRIITIAPELPDAFELIEAVSATGARVSLGHSEATYAEARTAARIGATAVTHVFNAMGPLHHREPGLAGFALMDPDIYVEVICDPFHLHPSTVEMIFRLKPAERILLVSDSVRWAGTPAAESGLTDTRGRLLGGSMTIAETSRRLIELGFDEKKVRMASIDNPSRYLCLSDCAKQRA